MLADMAGKNVLLLQGALGPFFRNFARELEERGANVTKVKFNAGDAVYYCGVRAIAYRGTLKEWPAYAEKLIVDKRIEVIFLLGDMRHYHRPIKAMAENHGARLYVFEEGYLRPDFITMEPWGVNGNSAMSKEPEFYRKANLLSKKKAAPVGKVFGRSAWITIFYYVCYNLFYFLYPFYRHYRRSNALIHGLCWVRSWFRKMRYAKGEANLLEKFRGPLSKKFYLYPLQVWNDFQIEHSPFSRVEECLEEVMRTFANHGKKTHHLVVKHHPADRGYRDYTRHIHALARELNIEKRVTYVHDLHLPTLLKHAQGVVVMNSTVGLSSIHHKTPVKVLGSAIYDIEGLAYQGSLAQFYKQPGTVDYVLYRRFRGWLEHHNQCNGNFYRPLASARGKTGVRW